MEKKSEDKNKEKLEQILTINEALRNIIFQKQLLQEELSEINTSLKEIKNSKGKVFKIIGQIMIESNKEDIQKDLLERKKITELRIKTFENQENILNTQLESLRSYIVK